MQYPEPAHPSCYTMSSIQSGRRRKRGNHGLSTPPTRPTTTSTGITKVTKSSERDDPNFRQRMIDNGIYPYGYEFLDGRVPPKPEEWKKIEQMLVERRASLSPCSFPEEEYDKFARADARVSSENKAMKNVIPIIQGTIQDERCVDGPDIPLNNLANMLTGTARKPKPDVWYGARHEQIQPPRIRSNDELGKYIVPSITDSRPCAPNFFVEAKGPGASTRAVLDQACFDGAFGARGIHKLQTCGQKVPTYDNKAYTLSATYHAGQLKMYAHHLGQPNGPETEPEYYMNQLKAWAMTSDRETLVKGMTAFRNGVEWTEAQRNAAIEHAKAVANGVISYDDDYTDKEEDEDEDELSAATVADPVLSPFTSRSPFSTAQTTPRRSRTARQESDTSSDELALDRPASKRPMREKHSR